MPPSECGLFRKLPEQRGAELIGLDNFSFHARVNLPDVCCDNSLIFKTLDDLMNYKYGTFNVGLAVASSLVSKTKNSSPDLEDNASMILTMIQSGIKVYEFTKKIIKNKDPNFIYLFNGRFCNNRAVMHAANELGVPVMFHERGANKHLYYLESFMPHDAVRWQEKLLTEWMQAQHSPESRKIGEAFYKDRRAGLEQSWISFTDHQQRGLLPKIDSTKRIITYFSSSDDEFVAIGDIFKFTVWKNQFDALNDLIAICQKDRNIQLIIRIHPHIREKSREDQMRWLSMPDREGVTVVSFDSDVDTYALIDRSDLVVTAGSTVGIEAVYWGRPSITLGPSHFSKLSATYYPQSTAQLEDLIFSNSLKIEREPAIGFGYYMATFGKRYKYYEPENLFRGRFLGVDLQGVSATRLKWLKLKQFLLKPYRAFLKVLNALLGTL